MSANLTMNPTKALHSLFDDRESALHVLMSMALRYLRHDKTQVLRSYLAMFDEYYVLGNGSYLGSPMKKSTIMSGDLDITFEIPAMKTLIDGLCKHFAALYRFRQENPGLIDPRPIGPKALPRPPLLPMLPMPFDIIRADFIKIVYSQSIKQTGFTHIFVTASLTSPIERLTNHTGSTTPPYYVRFPKITMESEDVQTINGIKNEGQSL
ncbi:hypothetical protein PTI98_002108 [Pleurotus ostreatus]|nr:hypothetical protein PTI98_002108 [Pleurotus ostreatus]